MRTPSKKIGREAEGVKIDKVKRDSWNREMERELAESLVGEKVKRMSLTEKELMRKE